VHAFTQACRSIAEPILDKPQNEISVARLLAHLFQVTKTFEMETQPQLLLLQKTLLTAEGVGRTLSPDANIWVLSQPLIQDWVDKNMGPETIVLNAVGEMANGLKRLPIIIANLEKNVVEMTNSGLKLNPDTIRYIEATQKAQRPASNWLYVALIIFLLILLFLDK
jgi:ubiquinone biosynthesis protein